MSIQEFFTVSDVEKIGIQLHELLRSDETLMGWTNGNIARMPFPEPIPDAPPPQIIVATMSEEEEFQPSGNGEVHVPVGVVLLWEDERHSLEADEPSIISVVQYIKGLLANNYYMKKAPNDVRVIRRVDTFETVEYGGVEVDGRIIRYLVLSIRFIALINVRTRKRNCYA